MQLDKNKIILLSVIAVLMVLIILFGKSPAEKRQEQVYKAQWYAEYGMEVPRGKTAEECLNEPQLCLNQ